MKFKLIHFILLSFFLIFQTGCESMESSWQDTQSENTIQAYERFIKKYPQSPFVDKAKNRIKKLFYKHAIEKNTIQGYEEFLKKYPRDSLTNDLKFRIMLIKFNKIRNSNSEYAYEKFLEQYPLSIKADSIIMELIKIKREKHSFSNPEYQELKKALDKNMLWKYESFLKKYPNGNYKKIVKVLSQRFNTIKAIVDKHISFNELTNIFNWNRNQDAYIWGNKGGIIYYNSDGSPILIGQFCWGNLQFDGKVIINSNEIVLKKGASLTYPLSFNKIIIPK